MELKEMLIEETWNLLQGYGVPSRDSMRWRPVFEKMCEFLHIGLRNYILISKEDLVKLSDEELIILNRVVNRRYWRQM